jgi:hypothetical protein
MEEKLAGVTISQPQHTRTFFVSSTSALNSATAGYVAGVTGVVFGHPLDSVKVWLQTNTAGKNKHMAVSDYAASSPNSPNGARSGAAMGNASRLTRPGQPVMRPGFSATMSTLTVTMEQRSATRAIRSMVNTARALYSGVSGPLLTVGIVQSINFTTYDAMRRNLHARDNPHAIDRDYLHNDSLTNVAISGFVSGTGLAFITSPLIMIKTKQQITGIGFRQALRESLFRNGKINLSGCLTGFCPHLISETMGRALYYVVYEASKRQVVSYKEKQGRAPIVSLQERMLSAAFAGISCWAFIYPFDVLRSRLYYQEGRASTMEMVRTIHSEKAFYRGFALTVLRAGPVAAAVLPVYDLVLENLSS